jgi:hypothetical protein
MNTLPGIGGRLFPSRYLIDGFDDECAAAGSDAHLRERQRRSARWWAECASSCGPASGLRALVDLAAMPLFGLLGYRASSVVFGRDHARALLTTPAGTPLIVLVLPWSARPSTRWRDAADAARPVGARWAFVLALPFLSLVAMRGFATRRSVEFVIPDALGPESFSRFWALTRAGAFDPAGNRPAGGPPIERAISRALSYQSRVCADLQHGVVESLGVLTPALAGARPTSAAPPRPETMRSRDEALTLVYRILFLLFAESRGLAPHDHPVYRDAYAMSTLCREALLGDPPYSLWHALAATSRLSRSGLDGRTLVVNAFNGHLFARSAAPTLERGQRERSRAANAARETAVARALVTLGTRAGPAGREQINYRDLGVEQLGAVYERVLDLDPPTARERPAAERRAAEARAVTRVRHSVARKQTGTFYTPQPLAEYVVRRTLAPLVAGRGADDILALRVLDPAMGSGAFLIAACRFLAAAHARALIEEGRASASDLDEHERANIRRLVAERCLVGVDRNPVAVQLARLSLWLATLAAGKPLTFLDHRLRVGDSLIGATPDDLRVVTSARRRASRLPLPLLDTDHVSDALREQAGPLRRLLATHDDTLTAVREKEALWRALRSDRAPLARWRLAVSVWCARWFWPSHEGSAPTAAEVRALLDAVLKRDRTLRDEHVLRRLAVVRHIDEAQAFFHWPLEFPDVFYEADGHPRAQPGFDAVLGNPPWEMLRAEPRRSAESHHRRATPAIGEPAGRPGIAPPALRRQLIDFIRRSGLYTDCDGGHLNLYQPFLERSLGLLRPGGRLGLVLPWSLASDTGSSRLRYRVLHTTEVDTLVGLDNAAGLFPIHRGMRFLVATATAGRPTREVHARFGIKRADELDELPGRLEEAPAAFDVRLSTRSLQAVGGSSLRIPDLRSRLDLALLEALAERFRPVGERPWGARFSRELNATEARAAFGSTGLPVLDGKHLTPYQTAGETAARIDRRLALRLLPDARFDRPRLGYRDVAAVGNRLSLIAALIPAGTVTTHTVFCLRTALPLDQQHFLCACFNSYVLNHVVRLLMGGHLTTSLVESLPVPAWKGDAGDRRIAQLAEHLSRESTDASSDEEGALLQALVAERFGLDHETLAHVLERFPLVPTADRTKALDQLRVRQNAGDAASVRP